MKIINPATERVIKNIKADTTAVIKEKYAQARAAQLTWSRQPLDQRLEIVVRFHDLLGKYQDKLAAILTQEVGKPINQSYGEINGARGRIQYFLDHSQQYLSDELVLKEEDWEEVISYEPLGVIANISAWNYPYLVGVNVFVPALIAGNAVLYKPSEYATLTGLEMAKIWSQGGLPEGLFQTVTGAAEAGKALISLPLQGYFFTGSYATGKSIYEQVALGMVPCQMELGGKDPLYITANNHNLKQVAQAAVEGAFYNNGQSCCAVERIYVHEKIYHDFINYFVQEVMLLKMGDPMNEEVFIGPLTRKEHIAFLQDQVQDALKKGGKVLCGGKPETRQGYYFQPTVVIDTKHSMKLMKEETFGPLIGIQAVQDDMEAIALMSDTQYGLTAAVFTEDEQQARSILKQMPTGTAYWNCADRVSARLPWAGRKHSGFGVTLSHQGIRAFTQTKGYHLRKKL